MELSSQIFGAEIDEAGIFVALLVKVGREMDFLFF